MRKSVSDLSEEVRFSVEEVVSLDKELKGSQESIAMIKSLGSILNGDRFSELALVPSQAMVVVKEGEDQLISTLLVRVGSITISAFIIFMLAPTYRYAMNMSAFYESRADSLSLGSLENQEELKLLMSELSPPEHNYNSSLLSLFARFKAKDTENT